MTELGLESESLPKKYYILHPTKMFLRLRHEFLSTACDEAQKPSAWEDEITIS